MWADWQLCLGHLWSSCAAPRGNHLTGVSGCPLHLRTRFYFLPLAAAELSAIPTVLYGTINGVIGVVASLPHATYQLLESLQASCDVLQDAWRSQSSEVRDLFPHAPAIKRASWLRLPCGNVRRVHAAAGGVLDATRMLQQRLQAAEQCSRSF